MSGLLKYLQFQLYRTLSKYCCIWIMRLKIFPIIIQKGYCCIVTHVPSYKICTTQYFISIHFTNPGNKINCNTWTFLSISSPINGQTHDVGWTKPKVFKRSEHIDGWGNISWFLHQLLIFQYVHWIFCSFGYLYLVSTQYVLQNPIIFVLFLM